MKRRSAFALVELFVVLAVLMLLIAFLLPAVQGVRKAAATAETVNKMKQLGIAVHVLNDTLRKLPDAYAPGGHYANDNLSLWFHLLPYVEQDAAYRQKSADQATVRVYIASDDPYNFDPKGKLNFSANVRVFGYQTLTPVACNAVGKAVAMPAAGTKVVSNLTLPRIVDGTSNTFMLSTRLSSCDRDSKDAPVPTLIMGDPGSPTGGFYGASAMTTAPSPLHSKSPTALWQVSPKDYDNPGAGKSTTCINSPSAIAHSFSTGGLLASVCDASVRSVSPAMSVNTFSRAMSPGDQSVLGEDWLD